MKGDVIVDKSGYVRLLVTFDHKRYAIPNSMTSEDWVIINAFWTLCQKKLLVFVTWKYVFPRFIKKTGRQAPIPSDKEIIASYCTHKIVTDTEAKLEYRPAHSALLLIDGTEFRLCAANGFPDMTKPLNFWMKDFYKVCKRHGLPNIYRNLGLTLTIENQIFQD